MSTPPEPPPEPKTEQPAPKELPDPPLGQPPAPPLVSSPGNERIDPSLAKDPSLIALLAVLLGGFPYPMFGQWQKGILMHAIWVSCLVSVPYTCGASLLLFAPLVVAIAVDAYMQSQLLQQGKPIGQWTFFNGTL